MANLKRGDKVWAIMRYAPGELTSTYLFGLYADEGKAKSNADFQTNRPDKENRFTFKAEELVVC